MVTKLDVNPTPQVPVREHGGGSPIREAMKRDARLDRGDADWPAEPLQSCTVSA
jgi:hypothetical protein